VILAFVLLAALHAPEECLGTGFSTEWQGKTYTFRFEDCRDEFLTDPERYSQLYDALREMQAEGMKVEPPKASLVPS
jgi:YHS domain-containing protein